MGSNVIADVLAAFFGVWRKRFVMFTVENEQKRFQKSLDVLAAIVTKLNEKVEQTQDL